MRKFIISDLHGDGNVYNSIMGYLDNISKKEEIELYINGDLIDRGIDSASMLLDIKRRIEDNKFKIVYLGGNHELLMYQIYDKRRKGVYVNNFNNWYENGGWSTDYALEDIFDYNKDKIFEVVDFVSDLKIYHKFDEKIIKKNIVLVHAACPVEVKDVCDLRIKDNNDLVDYYVWAREIDPWMPFRCRIGNDKYFSIIGHTPNANKYGYEYHRDSNYLNIDGGCSRYVSGEFLCDHVPLVEVFDGYLRILTFNNNNEIIYGHYFDSSNNILINDEELDYDRGYLNKKLKVRKLVRYEDDIIGYEE